MMRIISGPSVLASMNQLSFSFYRPFLQEDILSSELPWRSQQTTKLVCLLLANKEDRQVLLPPKVVTLTQSTLCSPNPNPNSITASCLAQPG